MRKIITIIATMSMMFVFCIPHQVDVAAASVNGDAVVEYAQKWIGVPYVYGGSSLKTGLDCGAFVCRVYENFGINLWKYRTTLTSKTVESGIARRVGSSLDDISNAQPGDLIHFPGHVSIYMGNMKVIHASTSKGVSVATLSKNSYWGGTGKKVDRIVRLNNVTSNSSYVPTPTKKPVVTPTPTKKPVVTPTPTRKPVVTPTPTKKPVASSTSQSSIRFELESVPKGNLRYGKSFSLKGWFRSDSPIVEARAYILDANKNIVMQSDKASSTTSNYKIQGYKLDKAMKFGKLQPGGYYLKYYVRDADGDTATWISDMFYIVK